MDPPPHPTSHLPQIASPTKTPTSVALSHGSPPATNLSTSFALTPSDIRVQMTDAEKVGEGSMKNAYVLYKMITTVGWFFTRRSVGGTCDTHRILGTAWLYDLALAYHGISPPPLCIPLPRQTSNPSFEASPYTVKRRYGDFASLHDLLARDYAACILPPRPAKQRLGNL